MHTTSSPRPLAVVTGACSGIGRELAKHVVRDMVGRGEGRILLTSSIASAMPGSFHAVYDARRSPSCSPLRWRKREEVKDSGVTVTSLMPGPTHTEFCERAGLQDTLVGAGPKDDPADVARDGFEALMAGRERVVSASPISRIQGRGSRLPPDSAKAKLHRLTARPGGATAVRRGFPQPIKATAHGLVDYGFFALMTIGPVVLGLDKRARSLSWGCAALQGAVDALTDHPVGVRRLIPLRIHGWIELATAPAFIGLPIATGVVASHRERDAWLTALVLLATNYTLTDYEAPADP